MLVLPALPSAGPATGRRTRRRLSALTSTIRLSTIDLGAGAHRAGRSPRATAGTCGSGAVMISELVAGSAWTDAAGRLLSRPALPVRRRRTLPRRWREVRRLVAAARPPPADGGAQARSTVASFAGIGVLQVDHRECCRPDRRVLPIGLVQLGDQRR